MNEIVHAPKSQIEAVTPMGLLQLAIEKQGSIDVIERLAKLQREEREYAAKVAFEESMSRCQSQMRRISADAQNPQTRSRYASYAQLDRALRPVYVEQGFALSFGTSEAHQPDTLLVTCHVSHAQGHSREYQIPMPADGKGAKGGDVMTKTHATGAAATYGMRYLLKMIFNVAIGEDDDDGNLQPEVPREYLPETTVLEYVDALNNAPDYSSLREVFAECWEKAKKINDGGAKEKFRIAYEVQKRSLK